MNIFVNEEERRPRALWRLAFQMILFILFTGIAILVRQALFSSSPLLIYLVTPLFFAGIASVWAAARLFDRRPLSDYGMEGDRLWYRELGTGLAIGTFSISAVFLLEWLGGWVSLTGFGWERTSPIPYPFWLVLYFVAALMVGFYEELIFRGYQILNLAEGLRQSRRWLTARNAVLASILISSVVFAAMHARNPNASVLGIVNIMVAGIVLAVPYAVTGRLALSIGMHISWNFVQGGILGFAVSGRPFRGSLFQIQQEGAAWITGSQFGPEAGLAGLTGFTIMMALFYTYMKKSGLKWSVYHIFRSPPQKSPKTDEQGL